MSLDKKLKDLREAIYQCFNSIYRYECPWEKVTENGTDLLGSFRITNGASSNPDTIWSADGYFRLKPVRSNFHSDYPERTLLIPSGLQEPHESNRGVRGIAIDMGAVQEVNLWTNGDYFMGSTDPYTMDVFTKRSPYFPILKRLILPTYFSYRRDMITDASCMVGGLYLSRFVMYNDSDWIIGGDVSVEIPVKCPVDAEVPYYLNKIGISANDLVGIFNNLRDYSGTSTTKTITIGSHNLAKLTEDQIAIAEAKGWNVA